MMRQILFGFILLSSAWPAWAVTEVTREVRDVPAYNLPLYLDTIVQDPIIHAPLLQWSAVIETALAREAQAESSPHAALNQFYQRIKHLTDLDKSHLARLIVQLERSTSEIARLNPTVFRNLPHKQQLEYLNTALTAAQRSAQRRLNALAQGYYPNERDESLRYDAAYLFPDMSLEQAQGELKQALDAAERLPTARQAAALAMPTSWDAAAVPVVPAIIEPDARTETKYALLVDHALHGLVFLAPYTVGWQASSLYQLHAAAATIPITDADDEQAAQRLQLAILTAQSHNRVIAEYFYPEARLRNISELALRLQQDGRRIMAMIEETLEGLRESLSREPERTTEQLTAPKGLSFNAIAAIENYILGVLYAINVADPRAPILVEIIRRGGGPLKSWQDMHRIRGRLRHWRRVRAMKRTVAALVFFKLIEWMPIALRLVSSIVLAAFLAFVFYEVFIQPFRAISRREAGLLDRVLGDDSRTELVVQATDDQRRAAHDRLERELKAGQLLVASRLRLRQAVSDGALPQNSSQYGTSVSPQ